MSRYQPRSENFRFADHDYLVTATFYDPIRFVLTRTNRLGFITEYRYDATGQVVTYCSSVKRRNAVMVGAAVHVTAIMRFT